MTWAELSKGTSELPITTDMTSSCSSSCFSLRRSLEEKNDNLKRRLKTLEAVIFHQNRTIHTLQDVIEMHHQRSPTHHQQQLAPQQKRTLLPQESQLSPALYELMETGHEPPPPPIHNMGKKTKEEPEQQKKKHKKIEKENENDDAQIKIKTTKAKIKHQIIQQPQAPAKSTNYYLQYKKDLDLPNIKDERTPSRRGAGPRTSEGFQPRPQCPVQMTKSSSTRRYSYPFQSHKHSHERPRAASSSKRGQDPPPHAFDFPHKQVIRKKAERAALPGYDCLECEQYYHAIGNVIPKNVQIQKCSRHRSAYVPYETPDDFWNLSFPDSIPQ